MISKRKRLRELERRARERARFSNTMANRENRGTSNPQCCENADCIIAHTCRQARKVCPFGPTGYGWCERSDCGDYQECAGQLTRAPRWDDRVMVEARLHGIESGRTRDTPRNARWPSAPGGEGGASA